MRWEGPEKQAADSPNELILLLFRSISVLKPRPDQGRMSGAGETGV